MSALRCTDYRGKVKLKDQLERGKLKASLGVSKLTADQQRIRELERELAIAKMERDILKKATAFFAKESK